MRTILYLLFTPALLFSISQNIAVGQTIIQHLGANDPVNEGFLLAYGPDAQLAPVSDDLGFDAWSIETNLDSWGFYDYYLPPNEQERIESQGWILTTRLRIVEPSGHAGLLRFFTGTVSYTLTFSMDINHNPVVKVTGAPAYTILGGADSYHEYRLEYDVDSKMAALWIDGNNVVPDIPTGTLITEARISFGVGESVTRTHWNEVTLTAIPEPAVISFLTGFGVILFTIYRRRKNLS